ncbi:MAG: nucleotidyl transferase AbiEii/AbiGii toxin family protein [Candidatus Aminicenantes bacterium]|nr:nucleotidyl transferase AbiEii/AbiGii toxin family protein [Candidatus Aminicenantes bacterium]
MSPPVPSGLAHSIQARLKNEAHRTGRPYVELLELFAVERFLYRLARSRHRDSFVLKGALLMRHWLGADSRPTRDIDLLGPVDTKADRLLANLQELLALEVEEDGIAYQPESIIVAPIRLESPVLGLRARFDATLGPTRLRYQLDVGLGDAVYPQTTEVTSGFLLGLPVASLRAYTPDTVVAEKLEAVVVLGDANSRIKDFYDLALMARRLAFDGLIFVEAIRRTFARRSTPFPAGIPEGLSDTFAQTPLHASRWNGFLDKTRLLKTERPGFDQIVNEIRVLALPALEAARQAKLFNARWPPGGPWR